MSANNSREEALVKEYAQAAGITIEEARTSIQEAPKLTDMQAESKRIMVAVKTSSSPQTLRGIISEALAGIFRAR